MIAENHKLSYTSSMNNSALPYVIDRMLPSRGRCQRQGKGKRKTPLSLNVP
jgi:hypothetical protein